MPYFYQDAEFDLDPEEFVSACNSRDLKKLVEILREDGHIPDEFDIPQKFVSPMEESFIGKLIVLANSYHRLTQTEIEIIESIAKRL